MISPRIWPGRDRRLLADVAECRRRELAARLDAYEAAAQDVDWDTAALSRHIQALLNAGNVRPQRAARRGGFRRTVAVAFIALLVLLFATTVLAVASPAFRDCIFGYILEWDAGHVDITIEQGEPQPDDASGYYVPGYVPEGYYLESVLGETYGFLTYSTLEEDVLLVQISSLNIGISMDTEHTELVYDYQVQGHDAIANVSDSWVGVMWHDDRLAYSVDATGLDLEQVLLVAESLAWQESAPEPSPIFVSDFEKYYVPGYLPEGYLLDAVDDEWKRFSLCFRQPETNDFLFCQTYSLSRWQEPGEGESQALLPGYTVWGQPVYVLWQKEADEDGHHRASVEWRDAQTFFVVQSQQLSVEELIKVAESLALQADCPEEPDPEPL